MARSKKKGNILHYGLCPMGIIFVCKQIIVLTKMTTCIRCKTMFVCGEHFSLEGLTGLPQRNTIRKPSSYLKFIIPEII